MSSCGGASWESGPIKKNQSTWEVKKIKREQITLGAKKRTGRQWSWQKSQWDALFRYPNRRGRAILRVGSMRTELENSILRTPANWSVWSDMISVARWKRNLERNACWGWPWESNMSTAVASLFHCHAGGSRANKHACQRSQTRLCFRLVIFALNLIRISYCH